MLIGVGTPRSLQGRRVAGVTVFACCWLRIVRVWTVRETAYPALSTMWVGDHDRSLIPEAA